MSDQLKKTVNSILEASGDILMRVGSEPGRLVPNAAVDVSQLNSHIRDYQQQLDDMELEIRRSMKPK